MTPEHNGHTNPSQRHQPDGTDTDHPTPASLLQLPVSRRVGYAAAVLAFLWLALLSSLAPHD